MLESVDGRCPSVGSALRHSIATGRGLKNRREHVTTASHVDKACPGGAPRAHHRLRQRGERQHSGGNQAKALLVTAEHDLRAALPAAHVAGGEATKTDTKMLMRALAELDLSDATGLALRILARRWLFLAEQITEANVRIRSLVRTAAPQLLSRPGIGVDCAARLLTTAGGCLRVDADVPLRTAHIHAELSPRSWRG